jgi:hypothetical protein
VTPSARLFSGATTTAPEHCNRSRYQADQQDRHEVQVRCKSKNAAERDVGRGYEERCSLAVWNRAENGRSPASRELLYALHSQIAGSGRLHLAVGIGPKLMQKIL